MRLAVLAVLSLSSLAACSPAAEPTSTSTPEAAAEAPVMLGGVDLNQPLRALGTEPFWSVAVTPDALVYSGVDQPERRADNPGPVVQGTTAVLATATGDGATMVVTLIATECSDGMSDRTYPLTARVELGELTLNGCAASQAFFDTTTETGEPLSSRPEPRSGAEPGR